MTMEIVSVRGGTVSDTSLILPTNMTQKRWAELGEQLGSMERCVGWWIGDWWNAGERYAERVKIVQDPQWKGPTHGSCRTYGSVAAKFEVSSRLNTLPFSHYQAVAALPEEQRSTMLRQAEATRIEKGAPPPVRQMRQTVKAEKRAVREQTLAEDIKQAAQTLGTELYGVILADPPWRFEPYSAETGMDRSAENHYPTMTVEELCQLNIPAARDCALFLWATAPMLIEAMDVMEAWGFDYRTHFVWMKDKTGTGYWNRNCHEILLLGVRGEVPAPAPGEQYDSVFQGAVEGHSVKPAAAAEMIEAMFPSAACLEMFARGPRHGWHVWGAEAFPPVADSEHGAEQTRGESETSDPPFFLDERENAA